MKKFFVSAGLVAIGAAALESAMADDTGPKYWSVGGTLRGFYDDNYNIGNHSKGSFGAEVSPTVSAHVPLQQTDMGIRYTYGLYYYQDRNDQDLNPFDQSHQVDLWLDHAFNERWHGRVTDTFSVGQEPELLTPNPVTGTPTPYRINGNNLSNHGNARLDTEWTRLFSTSLSYENNFYHYQQKGAYVSGAGTTNAVLVGPSGSGNNNATLAGLLNRDEHDIALDLKWMLLPETIVLAGYEFDWYDYLGNEPIAVIQNAKNPALKGFTYYSGDRNARVHKVYLGVQEEFTPNIQANVDAGAQYDDAYADPLFPTTSWNPYADLSVSYTYLPGSYVQLGFSHDISASDQVLPDSSGQITQYQEDSVVYVDVNHHITQKLVATVIGRVQYTTYNSGLYSSAASTDYGLGLNLTYQFNPHLSVDAGYNYDSVTSDIAGYAYNRNRVYLGLTANY